VHKLPWLVVFAELCLGCVDAPTAHHMHVDAGLGLPDAGQGPLKPASAPLQEAAGRAGAAGLAAPQPSDAGVRVPAVGASTLPRGGVGGGASPPPSAASPPALPQPGVGQLVITELMIDPKTLTDDEGEWIELANITQTEFDLMGCALDDGSKAPHSLMTSMRVPPRAYVTIARNAQPGFMPDYTESLSLTNSADTVALRCGDHEIDRVAYAKSAGFPIQSGASLALDPARLDALANDDATAWCSGRESYGPELGSPGRPNPACREGEEGDDAGAGGE
jgi:hypothetical protein